MENKYIVSDSVFQKLSAELFGDDQHPLLGCASSFAYGYYNLCDGAMCNRDANCDSNCCKRVYSSYYVCSSYWCDNGSDLAWLWWTLFGVFLFFCLISSMAAAKRRRQQAALAAAVVESANHNARMNSTGATTVTAYYNQPGGMAAGQTTMTTTGPMAYG